MKSARVEAIYIAPVKSLGLQRLDRAVIGPKGIPEDRRFFLVDDGGRLVTQRECGSLVQVRSSYTLEPDVLCLKFPDGAVCEGPVTTGAESQANFFGVRDVRSFEVEGPWSDALSRFAGRPLELRRAASTAYDAFHVSVLSEASVAELQRHMPETRLDERRFRPNIYISGVAAHGEDDWLGSRVRVGAATLHIRMRDERCVMTTHNPDTGEQDADTLKAIASYRIDQPKEINFGIYATVERPGDIAVGDAVEPVGA